MLRFDPTLTDQEVLDAETEEDIEIFDALSEFDAFKELRAATELTPTEQAYLYDLEESLRIREREEWYDVDDHTIEILETYSDVDFIVLRYRAKKLVCDSETPDLD